MNIPSVIEILKKCNQAYSEGNLHNLSEDEKSTLIENGIDIFDSEVTDGIYDIIYFAVKKEDPENEFFTKLTSNNTGYGVDVKHKFPAGSMTELKSGDWNKWKTGHDIYLATEKLDGCSIILTYKDKKLVKAASRGDGYVGKDILRHILKVSNVPQTVNTDEELIVRGELVCPKADIDQMLNELENLTGQSQKNGRNTIAGALNRKETNEIVFRYSHFVAYWDSVNEGVSLGGLINYGFEVPKSEFVKNDVTEQELIEKTTNWINNSKYELDGIILTQYGDLNKLDSGFETGTINPRKSKKWKISNIDETRETTVININWQVSKNGRLTPVLEVEPVDVCGCTITHVTGHNYQNVVDVKCGIGAKIKIKRSGQVIPYLQEIIIPSEEYNLTFNYEQRGVDIYTINDLVAQKESKIRQLEFFAKSLEIDQLGYANCKTLFEHYESSNEELCAEKLCVEVPEEVFLKTLGVNGGKAHKSLQEKLQNVTEVEFAAACGAFGPSIGKRILQLVYDKYSRLVVNKEELNFVEGFGETRICQYISHVEDWRETLVYLSNAGGIEFKKVVNNSSDKLNTYIVCFTGVRDKELEKYIQDNGGKVANSYTKDVNLLIVKDLNSTSSKMQKAKENCCEILDLNTARTELMNK